MEQRGLARTADLLRLGLDLVDRLAPRQADEVAALARVEVVDTLRWKLTPLVERVDAPHLHVLQLAEADRRSIRRHAVARQLRLVRVDLDRSEADAGLPALLGLSCEVAASFSGRWRSTPVFSSSRCSAVVSVVGERSVVSASVAVEEADMPERAKGGRRFDSPWAVEQGFAPKVLPKLLKLLLRPTAVARRNGPAASAAAFSNKYAVRAFFTSPLLLNGGGGGGNAVGQLRAKALMRPPTLPIHVRSDLAPREIARVELLCPQHLTGQRLGIMRLQP